MQNTHILDSLIHVVVMKIGQCYSAIKGLHKLFIAKYVILLYLFGRNRVYCCLVVVLRTCTIPAKKPENNVNGFTIIVYFL